mmetsp:Transcript_44986/g.106850  ORF Transcript_44986/g.106850 Transcript_44986/m.106850 type:complete len:296 (-) Transcript_44986:106-993(-)
MLKAFHIWNCKVVSNVWHTCWSVGVLCQRDILKGWKVVPKLRWYHPIDVGLAEATPHKEVLSSGLGGLELFDAAVPRQHVLQLVLWSALIRRYVGHAHRDRASSSGMSHMRPRLPIQAARGLRCWPGCGAGAHGLLAALWIKVRPLLGPGLCIVIVWGLMWVVELARPQRDVAMLPEVAWQGCPIWPHIRLSEVILEVPSLRCVWPTATQEGHPRRRAHSHLHICPREGHSFCSQGIHRWCVRHSEVVGSNGWAHIVNNYEQDVPPLGCSSSSAGDSHRQRSHHCSKKSCKVQSH